MARRPFRPRLVLQGITCSAAAYLVDDAVRRRLAVTLIKCSWRRAGKARAASMGIGGAGTHGRLRARQNETGSPRNFLRPSINLTESIRRWKFISSTALEA
jgi:hypothetical protein